MRLKIYLQTILSESYKNDYTSQKNSQNKPAKKDAEDYDF
jgi:ribosomal protein L33